MPPRPDHLRLVDPAAAPAGAAKPKAAAAAGRSLGEARSVGEARSLGDWLWHGLGAGVATASAGFATYAVIFSTGQVVPSGNFNLFGHYDRSYQARGAEHAAPGAPAPVETASADPAARDGVDPTPTGSLGGPAASQAGVPAQAGLPARQGSTGPGTAGRRRGPDGPILPAFTLRDVFDGKALVESRASLSVVKPGSVLDGAGEVLSIEKRGDNWVVLTRNGVIAGRGR